MDLRMNLKTFIPLEFPVHCFVLSLFNHSRSLLPESLGQISFLDFGFDTTTVRIKIKYLVLKLDFHRDEGELNL